MEGGRIELSNLELVTTAGEGGLLPTAEQQYFLDIVKAFADRQAPAITDSASCAVELEQCKTIKRLAKEAKEKGESYTKPVKALLDKINGIIKPALDVLKQAEQDSKIAMTRYDEQVRRAAQEAARIQQEAENKAAEAKRQALEDAALDAELEGRATQAAAIAKQAEEVKPAIIGQVVVKQEGARDNWKWRCIDIKQVKPEFTETILRNALITQMVKSNQGKCDFGPGIEIYNEPIIAVKI